MDYPPRLTVPKALPAEGLHAASSHDIEALGRPEIIGAENTLLTAIRRLTFVGNYSGCQNNVPFQNRIYEQKQINWNIFMTIAIKQPLSDFLIKTGSSNRQTFKEPFVLVCAISFLIW
jgi:hypothetical protein